MKKSLMCLLLLGVLFTFTSPSSAQKQPGGPIPVPPPPLPLEVDVVSPSPTAKITVTPPPGFVNTPCPPSNATNCTTQYPAGTQVTATATSGVPVQGHNWQFAKYVSGPPLGMNTGGITIVAGCVWTTNTCTFKMPATPLEVHVEIIGAPGEACDLAIKKTISPTPLVSGQAATATITVTNVGNMACKKVITMTDPLPGGLKVLSVAQGGSLWNCSVTGTNPPATVTCVWNAGLQPVPPGPMPLVTIIANVIVKPGTAVTNCATVSDPSEDTNPTNDKSCATVPVK